MLEQTQISRLAAMANQLRPDWPNASIYTFIAKNLSNRAYRDIAVALAYIAADPETKTPARLLETGPWWQTTRTQQAPPLPKIPRCDRCHLKHTPDTPCGDPKPSVAGLDDARRELELAKAGLCGHGMPRTNCTEHREPA